MKTPKTDAVCFDSFEHPLTQQNCEVVKADFARQLETELAEMREVLEFGFKIFSEPQCRADRDKFLNNARAILEKF